MQRPAEVSKTFYREHEKKTKKTQQNAQIKCPHVQDGTIVPFSTQQPTKCTTPP